MENKIKEYKIKLKQNVTGEQVAKVIFGDNYKINPKGWINGSSPLGSKINPKTNQPYYKKVIPEVVEYFCTIYNIN